MIRTHQLTKRYDQVTAVEDLNIHVEPGEIYGFLGPNGAGKTTTIMMLLGLVRPTAGKVWLFGKEIDKDYAGNRRRIGVLSEFHYLYEDMTAYEYLRFFGELYEVDGIDERIKQVLGLVNLYDRRNELLRGYSKGMKQKLSLARALLHDPDLLLLDEPVSSLDPYGIKEVRDILLELNRKGKTMFISSHILSEIERTCQRVAILNKGRLVAQDTMDAIKRRVSQDVELTVELEAGHDDVVQALRQADFVLGVRAHNGKVVVKTRPDRDYRAEVSRLIAQSGSVLMEMRRREMTLEEAFVTITDQNISLLAREGEAS